MFRSIVASALSLSLCTFAFAAPPKAVAKPISLSAAKRTYLNAYSDLKPTYVKLTGAALKEFKFEKKQGGSDFPTGVFSLPGKSKLAKSTAFIKTDTDGGSYFAIIKITGVGPKAKSTTVLSSGSQGESGDPNWSK